MVSIMMVVKSQIDKGVTYRYSYGRGMYSYNGRVIYLGSHYFKDLSRQIVSKIFECVSSSEGIQCIGGYSTSMDWLEVVVNTYHREQHDFVVPYYSERAPLSDDYIVMDGKRLNRNIY